MEALMNLTTKYTVVEVNNMMYVRVCVCVRVPERLNISFTAWKREEKTGQTAVIWLFMSQLSDPSPGLSNFFYVDKPEIVLG